MAEGASDDIFDDETCFASDWIQMRIQLPSPLFIKSNQIQTCTLVFLNKFIFNSNGQAVGRPSG
jgi:hypothetical protein